MSSKSLDTVEQFFEEFGIPGVAALARATEGAAVMWKCRKRFPPKKFVRMNKGIEAKGFTAPPSLWSME